MAQKVATFIRVHPKTIMLLFVILGAVSVGAVYSVIVTERMQTHALWVAEDSYSWIALISLNVAHVLVNSSGLKENLTAQYWYHRELSYAVGAFSDLGRADRMHANQLYMIQGRIEGLDGCGGGLYYYNFNATALSGLSLILQRIGILTRSAYLNYLNYTSTDQNGVPLWYSGPSPPDEALLAQTVELANQIPAIQC